MLRTKRFPYSYIRSFATALPPDHYATLELKRGATIKDIKAAFYKLSKKYHPDTNPEDPVKAADKFQKVVEAYEILGVEDKRKAYDYKTSPRYAASRLNVHSSIYEQHGRHASTHRKKEYTDLDIDYKDFEHFQRTNRRKRVFHEHMDMPHEFASKFGGTTKRDEDGFAGTNYRDHLHVQREMEERRLYQELEEIKRKAKHPLPSFEQLLRDEEANAREKRKKQNSIGVGLILIVLVAMFCVAQGH